MSSLIAIIFSSIVSFSPETPLQTAILDQAMQCPNIKESDWEYGYPTRSHLRQILEVEEQFDIPLVMRGMLLAMACHESGYNPKATGDFRGRHPMAIGLYQQWPWFEKHQRAGGYGISRRDIVQSSMAQMQLWVKQVEKAVKLCRSAREDVEAKWAIAQVRAARGPVQTCRLGLGGKDCNRCKQRSKHYDLFIKWRKNWLNNLPIEQVANNN